jgi:release factor glutamine methyltransferase
MEKWTITKLLDWITSYFTEKGIDSARLHAELILCHVLKLERIELYTNFDREVPAAQLTDLRQLVKRGGDHEPVAYLVQRTEFYSIDLKVTPATLIPRPETEMLVEKAIEFLRKREGETKMLDLCTGSGCIAIATAKGTQQTRISAADICPNALAVANENIARHSLEEKITTFCGDLFTAIGEDAFDLIVSNPPYIATDEYKGLDKNVKDYEPEKALHAGADGLDVYRRIAENAGSYLKQDGALMLEIGYTQGVAVVNLLEKTGIFSEIKLETDFQGHDRIIIALR